ncbi:TPA: hypothetical protein OTR37_001808 [Aeromonas dhakensis]|nr:hypothetical protein [Aeromonas dhakensis]
MTSSERFDVLKIELQLIQSTLDKYDDLIFRNRNFFITMWMASVGLAFTIKSVEMLYLASLLSILYWFLEGMMRFKYWIKYVGRYRYIRMKLNSDGFDINQIKIYDLTNHYKKDIRMAFYVKLRVCFLKLEPVILYITMAAASLLVSYFIQTGIISFTV